MPSQYVFKIYINIGDLRKVGSFSGHTLLDTAKYRMSAEELANVVWAFSSKSMYWQ
jgi:hypothetical protein